MRVLRCVSKLFYRYTHGLDGISDLPGTKNYSSCVVIITRHAHRPVAMGGLGRAEPLLIIAEPTLANEKKKYFFLY